MKYLAVISLALVGIAYSAPNHLKHVAVEKQVVVNNAGGAGNLGASASWGPFSASAGLGGSNDGGVASAGAVAPGAGAVAGIGGGSKASASASASASFNAGGDHVAGGPTIFDQIFNIPISVLKSVNTHLNNKETVPGAHAQGRRLRKCRRRGTCPEGEGVTVTSSQSSAGASAGTDAQAGAQAGAGATVYSKHVGYVGNPGVANAETSGASTLTVRKNYDNVFAIPISALRSVNELLNGKK